MFEQIYFNLCKRKSTIKDQWKNGSDLHRHHIIPKHSGGLDNDDNFTYLTIREHIIAHYLLWKIHNNVNDLRAMSMLGAHMTHLQRKMIGEWCRDNNIGFFGASSSERNTWRSRGSKTQIEKGLAIFDSSKRSEYASLGGKAGSKTQIEKGLAIFDSSKRSEYASLGGKSLVGMVCVTNGSHRTRIRPEKLDEYLSNGYRLGFTLSRDNE